MWRGAAHVALAAVLLSPIVLAPGCAFSELRLDVCGGFDDVEASCGDCVKSSCCAQGEACRDSAACSALFDCLKVCGADADCRATCAEAFPSDEAAAALSTCRQEICEDKCTNCGGWFHVESPSCDDCTRTSCCANATACYEDDACRGHVYCSNECDRPDCGFACDHEFPLDGGPLFGLGVCVREHCSVACKLGERFDCVDNFEYPAPVADTLTYETTLFRITNDFTMGEPLAGATFRACSRVDGDCSDPIAQTTLDAAGTGALDLPGGFDAYFESSGLADVPGELRFNNLPLLTNQRRSFGQYTRQQIDDAHALLGRTWLPDRGLLLVFPSDCDHDAAPGIHIDLEGPGTDEEVLPFYFDQSFPNPDLTETNPGTHQGGGFANVPAGLFTVRGIQVSSGREVANAQALVRAGWVTIVLLIPSP